MRWLAMAPLMLVFCGLGLSRAAVLPAMYGWVVVALGGLSGLAISITLFRVGLRKGLPHSRVWAGVAVLPLAILAPIVVHDLSYPRLNDVATDVENPLAFVVALEAPANAGRDMAYPEHFGPIVREAYPDVRPLVLNESPERVYQRAKALAERQPGWEIKKSDAGNRTLEGEVSTAFFRFVDDFVIRVLEVDGKARVDMRSKSRDGLVDAGANANRIRKFLAELGGED